MHIASSRKYSFRLIAALAILGLGYSGIALADPIPTGWTCSGSCGTLGANGVVTLSPIGNSSYEYVTTNGSSASAPLPSGALGGETNGSTLATPIFSATAGRALNFYFNYVTSGGAGYADYAWAELFNSSNDPVALLFTARTEPSGSGLPQLTRGSLSWIKLSGVPSAGFTNTMSLGSRRGVSIARNTTGPSTIFGSACTVRRLKTSKSPAANSPSFFASPIQNVPLPESTYKCSSLPT